MASSSNSSAPKVARQNSSLFGAIKNIVAAPLTWLSGADQDDQKGKRRRQQPVSEPDIDEEEAQGTPRTKRIRVHSPPRHVQASSYLDPPPSAFQPPPKRRTPAPVARSSSVSAYPLNPTRNARSNISRSTLSPIRLSRTMSIDPPLQLRRETSLHDVVMEPALGPITRELSMPAAPLSSRPSFRMRSSLTPQPQREVSEPPPLTSLRSNPTFVRAPPPQRESQPVTTLGNLVETVRSAVSPVRQHSSLLFGSNPLESRGRRSESVPVEKALFELDIYKTPLVPTRLRSANPSGSAAAIPDMFRPRRSSQLVLMNDDRRKVGGSHKSPRANQSKPYAGEGGMKKLLARRKEEEDIDADDVQEATGLMHKAEIVPKERNQQSNPAHAVPSDWFSVASAGAASISSGSSLRVGRSKTSRNHIARPAVPRSRLKYSAVFEEDGDDAMDGEDDEAKRHERAMLDEASKKLPTFELPAGFSFAKPEAKPLQNDLTNAKEPPISSLPFSFGKIAPLPESNKPETSTSRKENSEAEAPKPIRVLADVTPPLDSKDAKSGGRDFNLEASNSTLGGIPNFFATSSLVAKPLNLPATPPLSFGSTPSTTVDNKSGTQTSTLFGSSSATPADDKENPFWEGDKQPGISSDSNADSSKSALFSQPLTASHTGTGLPFSFGQPKTSSLPTISAPAPFTFDKPPGEGLAREPLAQGNVTAKAASVVAEAPKPLFGGFGMANQTNGPAPVSNDAPKPVNIFDVSTAVKPAVNGSTSQGTTATSGFSFGASVAVEQPKAVSEAASTEGPKRVFGSIEAPKPLFGNGAPFSFNNEKAAEPKAATPAPTPFSFGAPSTPTQSGGTSGASGFAFGASTPSTTPAPAPAVSFSFSGAGSSAASVPAQSTPFSFGAPAPVNPAHRPVTPPKSNDQEYRMEESPTRETQTNATGKPTLSFSFMNSTTSTSLFGAPAPSSAPSAPASTFSFGATAPTNPFSPAKTSDEAKPFSFGSPAPTPTATTPIGAPFSFGPSTSSNGDGQRPNTAGGFSFGGAATPTSTPAPFSFGNAAPSAPSLFPPAPTASAPGSPSTFNQPSPFSFNAPLPASSTPFTFGSQPASPAGSSSGLPSIGFGVASGGFGQAAPSSPFSAPAPLALSTSSGGTLFTIGAAPTPSAVASAGSRTIRKLPTRRTGAKR